VSSGSRLAWSEVSSARTVAGLPCSARISHPERVGKPGVDREAVRHTRRVCTVHVASPIAQDHCVLSPTTPSARRVGHHSVALLYTRRRESLRTQHPSARLCHWVVRARASERFKAQRVLRTRASRLQAHHTRATLACPSHTAFPPPCVPHCGPTARVRSASSVSLNAKRTQLTENQGCVRGGWGCSGGQALGCSRLLAEPSQARGKESAQPPWLGPRRRRRRRQQRAPWTRRSRTSRRASARCVHDVIMPRWLLHWLRAVPPHLSHQKTP